MSSDGERVHAHTLHFGVSCHHGGSMLVAGARKFADALTALIGEQIQVAVAEDYEHLMECVLSGSIQVAWLPPLIAARATKQGALLAAVATRKGAQTYRSAVVVRKDGPHQSIDQLAGARAAWVDAHSMSGYIFPRLYLVASGIDPARHLVSETFYGTAQLACKAVSEGAADFAGCYVSESVGESLAAAAADLKLRIDDTDRLRIIGITDSMPSDAAVLSPRLSPANQHKLRTALVGLHTTVEGRMAMSELLQAEELSSPLPEYRASLDFLRGL